MQNSNFITHFVLNILHRKSKLVILGNLGMPHTPKMIWQYQLAEKFRIYQQVTKSTPSPIFLSRYCKDIYKLIFGVLCVCLVTHTQNDSINLQKTLMFICLPKMNLIIPFFLDIFHFKKLCNLIGPQHLGP